MQVTIMGSGRVGLLSRACFANLDEGVADTVPIGVGALARRNDGQANVSHVCSAAMTIADAPDGCPAIVYDSTAPAIVDMREIYLPEDIREHRPQYLSIGHK
jgi:UDP-glucose 6-dehydrogenase